MRKGSASYENLKLRLGQLRRNLLFFLPDPPISKVSYSDVEFDSTRAYVVLAHAEIEEYCEELVRSKAQMARAFYDQTTKVSPVLRRIITYYAVKLEKSWGDVLNPSALVVESAFMSYVSRINDNNGVKSKNLEKLLFPLGIHERHLVLLATWLAQMNSFGTNRGALAHKGISTQRPPDPLTQLNTVDQLLAGLLELDRMIGRLR